MSNTDRQAPSRHFPAPPSSCNPLVRLGLGLGQLQPSCSHAALLRCRESCWTTCKRWSISTNQQWTPTDSGRCTFVFCLKKLVPRIFIVALCLHAVHTWMPENSRRRAGGRGFTAIIGSVGVGVATEDGKDFLPLSHFCRCCGLRDCSWRCCYVTGWFIRQNPFFRKPSTNTLLPRIGVDLVPYIYWIVFTTNLLFPSFVTRLWYNTFKFEFTICHAWCTNTTQQYYSYHHVYNVKIRFIWMCVCVHRFVVCKFTVWWMWGVL